MEDTIVSGLFGSITVGSNVGKGMVPYFRENGSECVFELLCGLQICCDREQYLINRVYLIQNSQAVKKVCGP